MLNLFLPTQSDLSLHYFELYKIQILAGCSQKYYSLQPLFSRWAVKIFGALPFSHHIIKNIGDNKVMKSLHLFQQVFSM